MRSRIYALPLVFQNVSRCQTRLLTSAAAPTPTNNAIKPYESIPGLSALPVIGPLHHFLPIIGKIGPPENFSAMLEIFHKEFGSVVKLAGVFRRADMVVLFEPEHYNQVYRAEDITPLRPGFETLVYYQTELRKEVYNGVHGLTAAQGSQWREFRTKVNPAMLKPKLVKVYAPGLEEIARDMVERLTTLSPEYIQNNFELEMTKFSLESVGYVGLGARLGCLQDDFTEDHPGRKLMQSAKDMIELGFKLELYPLKLWKFLPTPGFKKLVNAMDTQWNISASFIKQARQRINERDHEIPEEEKSIIEKLLAIDEKVAILMANEMLMAGIDTVAFSTTALLYHLAKNPNVQDKLRKEIRSGTANRRYLKACIKETLRLHPVVSSNLRRTTKEHVVAGYRIPIGVDVIAPNEYLSRSETYYPRPKEFIPERWLAEKSDPLYYGNAHPMVTLPFGFGVRMCIGRRIAELEIKTLVHNLVKDYVIKWDGPPIKSIQRIMNKFEKPYYFKFEKVN
ncbi:hypothetical protein O0L34_g5977 [Tuta absoluta]|nr:hypothetical protein O0L34_g5977 [Tuta absoluta]